MSLADEMRDQAARSKQVIEKERAEKAKQAALQNQQLQKLHKKKIEALADRAYETIKKRIKQAAHEGHLSLQYGSAWERWNFNKGYNAAYLIVAEKLRNDGFDVSLKIDTKSYHEGVDEWVNEERTLLEIAWK
jgi:hypothetical protein